MSTFATYDQLVARLSPGYEAPSQTDAEKMLLKASELIDFATMGRAEEEWEDYDAEDPTAKQTALTNATCDQVEYWLEVGEEHDVLGLAGAMIGGRVQVQKMPGYLGKRTLRTLLRAGLYWSGVGGY